MAKRKIDYTQFSENGPPKDPNNVTSRWWLLEDKVEKASAIAGVIKYVQEHSGALESQRQTSARLYGNTSLMGANGLSYSRTQQGAGSKERISFNVVQSVIDTITAKIAKNKPKPLFLTEGGDDKMQRKAKKLDKFVEGVMYENEIYALSVQIFRDACVYGTGAVHVYEKDGRVAYERVHISEIVVDEIESFYGEPRQMHRTKTIDRGVALELWGNTPENRKAIEDVSTANTDQLGTHPTIGDQILVAESWHLPSGEDATDGQHVISINGHVLFEEEWEEDFFPFAFYHWCKRLNGFWGQGLAEQIQNIQLEINKLLWVIQRSMHLAGTFKVFMENGSKIVKEHVNNDIGAIVNYTGTAPQYVTPPIVPPEIYQHLTTLKQSAYEQAGISQLSAASTKPAGLDSGKALREYNDIESDRFQVVGQAYERLFLDLAKLSVWKAKEIYEDKGKYQVKVPGKKFIETIDWKDVDLTEDEYVLKLFPVSQLPSTPEGKLQTIQELMQAGIVTPQTGRRLLDYPDLDQVEQLANAVEDRIMASLDSIVEDGEYKAPDEFMDLQLARQRAIEFYNQAVNNNLDDERLGMIQEFISQIGLLETQAQSALQPPAGPGGQAPMANPTPTPQSQLLPNLPATQ